MGRVAWIRTSDITGRWYAGWRGQASIVTEKSLHACAMVFADHEGISVDEFTDQSRGKWTYREIMANCFEVREVDASPPRQPRVAKVKNLGSAWVGWWTHVYGAASRFEGPSLNRVLVQLANAERIPVEDLLQPGHEHWKVDASPDETNLYLLTEILPEASTTQPCPTCAHTTHPGKYHGLHEIENCPTCGGKAVVAR